MDVLSGVLRAVKKRKIPYKTDNSFQKLTTLCTGGKIFLTVYPQDVDQLVWIAKLLKRRKVTHTFIGNGSNVLAGDCDYDGVAVVTKGVNAIEVDGQYVTAFCGANTASVSAELVKNGLTGGEFLGCIPATVGGAVVCNAGCFNQCVSQIVASADVLYRGRRKTFAAAQCKFGKRTSAFKNNPDYLVLSVTMRFPRASAAQVRQTLSDMRKKKAETQPLGAKSAGCVLFDDKVSVSKLIDQAGLKGFVIGGAQVSEKHAGFVINLDKATSTDIYLLIEFVKNVLREKFGVNPQTELCLVNMDAVCN
ncbi:MAG: UDP-N-acetylmuramate dehydrogenase [Corallococcus sp.]|nr:UDP-N-acetylmuramate dehydrogenase [Corallococcus sp.]MCM1358988.1 UDP-N-acetylmuramate dehydrogenase [Corallococcus sp.]MCM1394977.1 UDP-N-acetylmuramate dehydrogenase [Corallococcus sp.]